MILIIFAFCPHNKNNVFIGNLNRSPLSFDFMLILLYNIIDVLFLAFKLLFGGNIIKAPNNKINYKELKQNED